MRRRRRREEGKKKKTNNQQQQPDSHVPIKNYEIVKKKKGFKGTNRIYNSILISIK